MISSLCSTKHMKIKDYVEIKKPIYRILKITPHTSIRNYNSSNIAKTIQYMYKNIYKRIRIQEKKFIIQTPMKCSYMIDIEKNNVSFYFLIPERYVNLIMEKITETWKSATIEEVDEVKSFSDDVVKYQLKYDKEDALSLKVDKKSNEPLNSILNVLDIMQENDRVGIFYNFMPVNQYGWKKEYQDTINKINSNQLVNREKCNLKYLLKQGIIILINIVQDFINSISDFLGAKKENLNLAEIAISSLKNDNRKKLSLSTINKKNSTVINTQMMVLSESHDKQRQENNAIAVLESYNNISEDNNLTYKKIPKKNTFYATDFKIIGADENKLSIEECQNLFQIPGKNLLEQHGCINKINRLESLIPKELKHGYIRLGTNTFKGKKSNAYMSDNKDLANLGIYIMGKQGSGKTEYLKNMAYDIINHGEGLTVIDYIKKCDLASTIEEIVPKERLTVIDLSKENGLQGFGFNEITIDKNMSAFEILEYSSLQAQLTMELINSIYVGEQLSGQMRRYLSSSANLVYTHPNSSLKDVINCLEYVEDRHKFIDNLRDDLKEYLKEEIRTLYTLDNVKETKDKSTGEIHREIIGTNESYIKFILDRVNLLKEDFKLKMMFNKDISNNINFVKEMEKGNVVLIKIPQAKYPLPHHKNVLATFFMSKLWLSAQIRGDIHDRPLRHSFMIDEIFQAPNVFKILLPILTQLRKFQLKPILSGHYLSQVEPIREALKASGCSYMLLKGTDKRNYNELEDELKPYTLEDLLNLEEYNSLNLIATKSETYARFITKLPPKLNVNNIIDG